MTQKDNAAGGAAPIGMFDSGVGGLTVARTLVDQLPDESLIYIGDTAHAPYGPKSAADVFAYSAQLTSQLIARNCKLVVVACNTASAVFLDRAREEFPIPVIGVIEPAARRATAATRNGRIGVIGTTGTINSGAYQRALGDLSDAEVFAVDCPQFVPFVERGVTSGRQILGLAQGYLAPLVTAGVDTVIMGCTHYPLLSGVLQLALGPDVTLVSSAEETAKDVHRTLYEMGQLNEPQWELQPDEHFDVCAAPDDSALVEAPQPVRTFEATGDPQSFARLARRFLGPSISEVSHIQGSLY